MPTQSYVAVRGVVRTALTNRAAEEGIEHLVAAGLTRLMDEGRSISGGTLHTVIEQLRRGEAGTGRGSGPRTRQPANGHWEPGGDEQLAGLFQ
jgi:short subunit dehydrogenase-like uncharacterized protein